MVAKVTTFQGKHFSFDFTTLIWKPSYGYFFFSSLLAFDIY